MNARLLQALRDKANKAEAKLEALNELIDEIAKLVIERDPLLETADVITRHVERRKREADEAVGELVKVVQAELRGGGRPS